MEPTFDLQGRVLPADPAGADTEGVAALPDGSFWVCEEYGPSLMKVDADGVVRRRWTPQGHTLAGAEAVLPKEAKRRRLNRGLEGLTVSGDGGAIYAVFQSAFAPLTGARPTVGMSGRDALTRATSPRSTTTPRRRPRVS